MKKNLLPIFLIASLFAIGQRQIDYRKTYYFNESMKLPKCNAVGETNLTVGTGASAAATVNTASGTIGSGSVSTISVITGGSNYSSAPLIDISGGGGSGASAVATVSEGVVTGITIISGGSGYTSNPKVGFTPAADHEIIYKATQFQVDKQIGDDLVVHMLKWQTNRENKFHIGEAEAIRNNAKFFGNAANDRPEVYFKLPLTTFLTDLSVGEIVPRVSALFGIVSIPAKIRKGDANEVPGELKKKYFDFQGSVNVGISGGVSININRRRSKQKDFINFLAGVSLSSVPVDSFSSRGLLKQSTNAAAISLHSSVMYQKNNLQAGIFFGFDKLAGELGRQWIYKNDMWMGIGVGVSLFRSKYTTDNQ